MAFAVTGKILYLDAPVEGTISFNPAVQQRPQHVEEAPYGRGWLFRIRPSPDAMKVYAEFADARGYVRQLQGTEGAKNPDGVEGVKTGMCRAVYRGTGDGLSGSCC